jgi:exodeoxyribonuclease VII small subunit
MARKNSGDQTQLDFEKSLQELEQLVTRLERGDLPLADSLLLFEQGVALTRSLHGALSAASQRVEILLRKDAEQASAFQGSTDAGDE